jgi:uncharacterized repeat protein (TIGR03803 family)
MKAQVLVTGFLGLTLVICAVAQPKQLPTLTVLYSFTGGTDGATPGAGLIRDKEGNLYGTTIGGGSYGFGTVFKVDGSGNETVLRSFSGETDGATPGAGLIRDKEDNLYGTTVLGGDPTCNSGEGCGTVFKLDMTGKETVLHRFTNTPDGAFSGAGLVRDKEGNLYSTTVYGGSYGEGTVFKLDPTGRETVLYSFTGYSDGGLPDGDVIMDKVGNLYGTTDLGGSYNRGTVFKLDTSGEETVLHSFADSPDGALPAAGLVGDKEGNLYGTTVYGGTANNCPGVPGDPGVSGCGTVFKVDTTGEETVLYRFSGGTDGAAPSAGLIMDKEGNLYGTTSGGGGVEACAAFGGGLVGCGTVFKLDTTGKETVLHSFTCSDGAAPSGGLIRDKERNLYGTTSGVGFCGWGTVFKLHLGDRFEDDPDQ